MKIYTKTGDDGTTGLFGGKRVSKSDPRIAAYGEVDELNALLGVTLAFQVDPELKKILTDIQVTLFELGADLAAPEKTAISRISESDALPLEKIIDALEEELPPLRKFILPAGGPAGAHLHLARTVCRRAERAAVELSKTAAVNPATILYLNRLSDLLFVIARAANHRAGVAETEWEGRSGAKKKP